MFIISFYITYNYVASVAAIATTSTIAAYVKPALVDVYAFRGVNYPLMWRCIFFQGKIEDLLDAMFSYCWELLGITIFILNSAFDSKSIMFFFVTITRSICCLVIYRTNQCLSCFILLSGFKSRFVIFPNTNI